MAVKGFYEETKPLSDKELVYANFIGRIFTSDKHPKDHKITGPKICAYLKQRFGLKSFPESRFRKCINHLRTNAIAPVVSDNRGYWQAMSEKEVDECIESLEDRMAGMQIAIDGLRQMKAIFSKPTPPKPKDGKLF